jgi:tRNA G18 (ribose-2'-O)-methylase SpoU
VFERIVTVDDPRVAAYRGVSDPELLRSHNLFIAEGRIVVTRLIEDGRWTVRSVLVSNAALRDLEPTLAAVAADVPIYVCESTGFLGITGHQMHRGCLALVERPAVRTLDELLGNSGLAVVLEGVTNPDNVGGVFRNAAAFGADAVLLSPTCCSPLYRKAIRTSMGAALRIPFVHLDAWPSPLMRLRGAGFTMAALVVMNGEPSETLEAFGSRPRPRKLALMIGAEGPGLTPSAVAAADHRVTIPIEPAVDSLNLAVAAGIALERLTRDTRGRGILAARTQLKRR